jgi:hypothetical protein
MTDDGLRDDLLAAELERRSSSAHVPPDWARREFLEAVTTAIDTRPQHVPASRLSPIVGLAGIGAVLLLLVVAIPRLAPGVNSPVGTGRQPSAPPSLVPTPQVAPSPTSVDCGGGIWATDTTGQLSGCTDAGGLDRHSQAPHVSNLGGDLHTLHIWWGTSTCVRQVNIAVTYPTDTGYLAADRYVITLSVQNASDCGFMPDAHAVDLRFEPPVPISQVSLHGPGTGESLPGEITTLFNCSPKSAGLAAPGSNATLTDWTGRVRSCAGVQPVSFGQPPVSNPDGDQLRLLAQWDGTPCDAAISFVLKKADAGYYLAGYRPQGTCEMSSVQHALEIQLTQPIDANSVLLQVQQ